MENIDVRITQYPRKVVVSDFDIFLIADVSDIDVVTGFPKYKKVLAKDLPSIINIASDITYADLLAKALEGELSVGEFYNLIDSTSGISPILVQAVSDSAIGYLAFDGDNPLLSINYDFITDTVRWSQNQETAPLSLAALSAVTPISYDDTTGVFTISQSSATTDGYLSATDWAIFDAKQDGLSGTGLVKSTSGTISYITDNSSNWNTAYNDSIVSAAVTGTATKLLTLTQQDGGTITASWSDIDTNLVTSVFGRTGAVIAQSGDYTTTLVTEGTNLYFTDTRARASISNTVTGLTYTPLTGVLSATAGYGIPTTASQTNWDTAYTNRITSATAPLSILSNAISISQASSISNGYLSSGDWTTFNSKQDAGNYITALTGEATASGPNSASVTLSNSAVIGKVLTGLNVTGGSISASDSILNAFGKVQNQINGLIGGSIYQGVWNASTNFPNLTSGVGTQGYYYIVSVAGSTNLDGITDWNIGDWAIFDGTAWQQVDNTDAVVSVNGQVGIVSLSTTNISEGTNLYYTDVRVSANSDVSANTAARHNAVTLGTANGLSLATQQLSLALSSASANGALSSTDWSTFSGKQNALSGTGIVKSVSGTISYLTDNSTNWNTAYNDSIISAGVTGTSTKTLTLNQQDGGTVTASWTDLGLTSVGLSMPSAFTVSSSPLTSNGTIAVTGAGTTAQYIRGDGSLATFPAVASEAQRLITEVYNETGATLTKGTVVYINGGHGNLPTVTKALATSDATSAQTYGVVQNNITDNNNGFVVVIGSITDVPTNTYLNGTILYLSPTTAGEWTSTKPYAPQHLVYVGIVTRSHPTQGVVEIRVQNGYEMDELHNVAAQSPSNGDILQFNYSTQLWTKTAGTTTNIAEGTNLYYTAARFNSAFSGKTTTDLTEGTNLYYTATRFNTAFSLKSTTDLDEGTNLYFTDTRARAAITLTTTGTSGVATYTGGVLNIPNYGSALSGYLPLGGGTLTGALYGTTATFSGIVSAKGSAPYYQWLNASDVRLGYIQHNGTDLVIATDTGDVVLSPNGKVGIKTSTPSENLTIGDGTATNSQYVRINASASDIYIGQSGGTLFGQSANSAGFVLSDNSSFPFVLGTTAAQDFILGTNNTVRFTINGSTGAITATSSITASSFVKSGGTSAQFLKADGSVDSTSYGTGTVTSVAALTLGTTGTDLSSSVANGTTTPVITLNVPTASATNRGALSSADWTTFNNKQNALTNPVTGTGTTNYLPKFTGTSALGNSILQEGTNAIGLGVTPSAWSVLKSLEMPFGASFSAHASVPITYVNSNSFYDGSNWIYKSTYSAGMYLQDATEGAHKWFTAGSGTAGNVITFAERMRITSSGNVLIGTTTDAGYKLDVNGTARVSGNFTATGTIVAAGADILGSSATSDYGNLTLRGGYAITTASASKIEIRGYEGGGATQGAIIAYTNGTERLRVTQGGKLLIGRTTSALADSLVEANSNFYSSGSTSGFFWEDRSGGSAFYGWYTSAGTIYLYNGSANIASINTSTGIYTPLSDFNKKKDFEQSTIGLNEVLQLKPTLYRMKTDDESAPKELGFIAQEVKEFIPQAYIETGEEDSKFIGLNDRPIIAALVKAVQEQNQLILDLQSRISDLELK